MNILITGASGMVGSHVLRHLLNTRPTDTFIAVCGWTHKGEPDNLTWAMEDHTDRVSVITHDLSQPFTPRTLKKLGTVDGIINIASESHVDRSIEEPVDFIQNNVNLTLTLLEYARVHPIKFFLQFSTDEVYGVASDLVKHKEWSAIVPSNPYSASKACQEAIAISYWRTYGVPVIITNTMNVVSERQDWEKFVPLCVSRVMTSKEIHIHAYPGASRAGSRFYIHADTVAEAVHFILSDKPNLYPESERPTRYNIVGDIEIDNLTLAQSIADILGRPLVYKLVDAHSSRPGHDVRYALCGDKLAEAGWQPSRLFVEKLTDVVLALQERFLLEND